MSAPTEPRAAATVVEERPARLGRRARDDDGPDGEVDGGAPAPEPAPEDADGPVAASAHRTPARNRRRRFWLLLLLPLVVGAGVRILFGFTDDVPTNDATAYLRSGSSIWAGDGFIREGSPELHFPPLTPTVLAGAANVFDDPLTGLVVTTAAFSTALLVPLSLIGRRIGGDRAGLTVAWIGALAPALSAVMVNSGGGSEPIFLFFMLFGLLGALGVADRVSMARRALYAAGSGLCTGAAYLTRPEGFGFVVVFVPLIVVGALGGWRAVRRRRFTLPKVRDAAVLAGVFAIALGVLMAPYVSYLHTNTGRWELTAKSRDASIEAWRAVAEHDRRARDQVLYELDETGYQFVADRETLPTLAREDPSGYAGIVGVNLKTLGEELTEPQAEPWPSWELLPPFLLPIAAWAAWRNRHRRGVLAALGLMGISTATALVFFVQPRYVIPAVAMLVLLVGVGIAQMSRGWRWVVLPVTTVFLALSLLGALHTSVGYLNPREPYEHRLAGEWLDEHSQPTDRIMTRSMVVGFYADRQTVAMPYSGIYTLLDFARHHGVRYIVLDEYQMNGLRPQFYSLFHSRPQEGLTLAQQWVTDGRVTRIYELTPPPKRGSTDAPGVGFVGDE